MLAGVSVAFFPAWSFLISFLLKMFVPIKAERVEQLISPIPIIWIVNIFASFFFGRSILKAIPDIIAFHSQIFPTASLKNRHFLHNHRSIITTNKSDSNSSVPSNMETVFRFFPSCSKKSFQLNLDAKKVLCLHCL